MEKDSQQPKDIIENMPTAFAYHEIIYDENNKPVDYVFLKVNNKFEEVTGLNREDVIDKKATDVLDNITNSTFDWIQFYGEIALTGNSVKFEEYSEPLGRWYEVKAYSKERGYFTTIFNDITERKIKERKLKKKTNSLNYIFNNLDDIIWSISWPDLQVRFISKAVKDIVGYTKEEFKEDPLLLKKITHPDDKNINKKFFKRLEEEGYTKREFRVICKDGSIKWLYDKGKMVYDENDNPVRVEGVMRDITERKETKVKLKYSREMYETIFNSAPLGIIIENDKGDIIEVNEAMSAMSGYDKEELEGSNIIDKFVLPKYEKLAEENIKSIINGENLEYDIETPTKTGEMKYYHLKETNITFPDGSKNIISMQIDITERKKKKEKIEKQRKRMEYILEGTEAGTWEWNVQTGDTVFDEKWAEMLGYTLEEISPTTIETWKEVTHPEDLEKAEKMLEKHFNGEIDQYDVEIRMKHKDGHWVWVLDKGKVISWTDDGKPLKMFGVKLDITDRKRREKKIEYLSYKDQLTGLYNRRYFEEEMKRLDTKRQLPISIIMADVTGLKIINDTYGHSTGDDLLIKTAEILNNYIRQEDLLARWAGDEFVILLPKTTRQNAQKMMERIKNKNKELSEKNIPFSIAMGVASKSKMSQNIKKVLGKADDNMYQNKLLESRSARNKIVQNLLNTLGTKSSESKEHAIRMKKSGHKLGKKLGLPNSELNKLSLLASLHDIGKTTISEDILTKPGKLTDEEWEVMKEHPVRGYKIASASEEITLVADEILSHHEHWDGSGYPKGLEGENIPFLARIISIIDAYDVMTHERPYSEAISKKEALAEIKSCAGSQFDPELAEEFIELQKSEN